MPLSDVFIVSSAGLTEMSGEGAYQSKEIPGLEITVNKASGEKCERCWRYSQTIGQNTRFPTACDRCTSALDQIL